LDGPGLDWSNVGLVESLKLTVLSEIPMTLENGPEIGDARVHDKTKVPYSELLYVVDLAVVVAPARSGINMRYLRCH
jgi:hypothetical protein